jgi:NAD(P)H-dependent FMN reductase
MAAPKILVVAGSLHTGSPSARLAALAVKELALVEADVTRISLVDYPLPPFDGDGEPAAALAMPQNAVQLKRMLAAHHGVFIVAAEYNASVSAVVKTMFEWISRVRDHGERQGAVFKRRVFALGIASSGGSGGMGALGDLRRVLEAGCGAQVIPNEIAVANADQAFDDMDNLRDHQSAATLKALARALADAGQQMA